MGTQSRKAREKGSREKGSVECEVSRESLRVKQGIYTILQYFEAKYILASEYKGYSFILVKDLSINIVGRSKSKIKQ